MIRRRLRAAWTALRARERPDQAKHDEGLAHVLTADRLHLVDDLEGLAFRMGATQMVERIGLGAQERYGHLHITQLLVRKHLKQMEFTEELISAVRGGRGSAALSIARPLLEGAVELSWAAEPNLEQSSEDRLLRILRRAYERLAEHGDLPAAEQAVLDEANRRGLKLSPKCRNAMEEIDAAEKRAGGKPYWESHYRQFGISSDYDHPTLLGPGRFAVIDEHMHVDMKPDPLELMTALRWGSFYVVRGLDAVLRLAELEAEALEVTQFYGEFKPRAEAQLKIAINGR